LQLNPEGLLQTPAREALFAWVDGDARKLLSALESLSVFARTLPLPLSPKDIADILQQPSFRYDKKSAEHYDTISAFIKSVRGSDPQAAIYYLARMLAGGEDPVFIARRLVILASEDIGNADPRGLSVAVGGLQAVELVGMPEAAISLAQVTTYLSCAPKSNASYMALKSAQAMVEKTGALPIPLALRSARTRLAKQLGYGEGYNYAHEGETGWRPMEFLPDELHGQTFYEPVDRGFEKTMRQYLQWMKGERSKE
jgi:putative ATPase